MFVKGTISIKAQGGDYRNNRDTEGVFKNCSSFTNCIGEINNIQIDNAKDIHIVMSMYILVIQYGNFWRTFAITDTKVYVPVVALSTKSNAKLLQELKSGFKRIVNWKK